jgi:hypothetical protein
MLNMFAEERTQRFFRSIDYFTRPPDWPSSRPVPIVVIVVLHFSARWHLQKANRAHYAPTHSTWLINILGAFWDIDGNQPRRSKSSFANCRRRARAFSGTPMCSHSSSNPYSGVIHRMSGSMASSHVLAANGPVKLPGPQTRGNVVPRKTAAPVNFNRWLAPAAQVETSTASHGTSDCIIQFIA